jgi:small GTP-binding protein
MDLLTSTGIESLDEAIGGGIKRNSSCLIIGKPGIDTEVFFFQIMDRNKDKDFVYYLNNKTQGALIEKFEKIVLLDKKLIKKIKFIDAFSSKVGMKGESPYFLKKEEIGEIENVIEKVLDESLFFYDSIDANIFQLDYILLLERIIPKVIKKSNFFCLLTNWNFDEKIIEKIASKFDYVIEVKSIEERFMMRNYFYVRKAPGIYSKNLIPFRIGMGGISVYVPKILITGPFHSGKSSFIQKVSTRAVSVDRLGTTIALDHGYIEHSGLSCDLFGTPGQERFEFMLDILKTDAFGVILVLDSTDVSGFDRGIEMLKLVRKEGIPYIVAANKQDLPNSMKPEEVEKILKSRLKDVKVIGTSAVTGEGCMEAVKTLIEMIIR